jgi:hypothetical protein
VITALDREIDVTLVSRLCHRHPAIAPAIRAIADEVERDANVRRPNAVLTARVSRLAVERKHGKADPPTGGFTLRGEWSPRFSNEPLTALVWMLCTKRRRDPAFAPRHAQHVIDARGFTAAFDRLDCVTHPDSATSWAAVIATKATTRTVVLAGRGKPEVV